MNDYPRKKREGTHRYDVSRWVPIVKDIMEDCIENNLDKKSFPYLFDRAASSGGYVAMNSRYCFCINTINNHSRRWSYV